MLETVRRQHDLTIVLATHDPAVAAFADRLVHLAGGRIDGEHRLDRAGLLEARALEDR